MYTFPGEGDGVVHVQGVMRGGGNERWSVHHGVFFLTELGIRGYKPIVLMLSRGLEGRACEVRVREQKRY